MKKFDLKNLGGAIIFFRKKRHLSQQALADLIQTNAANISRIEQGKQSPTAGLLYQIAQALDVTTDELLCWPETPQRPVPNAQPPSAVETAFRAWCDRKGLIRDKYRDLAFWLIQHLDPASLSDSQEWMNTPDLADLQLVLMPKTATGDAEFEQALETMRRGIGRVVASPGKARNTAG